LEASTPNTATTLAAMLAAAATTTTKMMAAHPRLAAPRPLHRTATTDVPAARAITM